MTAPPPWIARKQNQKKHPPNKQEAEQPEIMLQRGINAISMTAIKRKPDLYPNPINQTELRHSYML